MCLPASHSGLAVDISLLTDAATEAAVDDDDDEEIVSSIFRFLFTAHDEFLTLQRFSHYSVSQQFLAG